MSEAVRVVLADDQALVRAGFRMVLERDGDIDVVAEAGDGGTAVDEVRWHRPDVVLMDIRMPLVDGLEATRRIVADGRCARARIVVVTTFELDEYISEALEAGASGFLLKDIEPDDLRRAVRVVAAGQALLSPSVTRRVLCQYRDHTGRRPKAPERLDVLTNREREVVAAVAEGLSNDEIAGRLFLSPATVKSHVSRSMTKLGARDRAQLVVIAFQTGLVEP